MNPKVELEQLLSECGAVLVRRKKHVIYRLPDGVVFTVSATPEDRRAYQNALGDLRRLLGIARADRGQPGERRPRKVHVCCQQHNHTALAAPPTSSLAAQLKDALR